MAGESVRESGVFYACLLLGLRDHALHANEFLLQILVLSLHLLLLHPDAREVDLLVVVRDLPHLDPRVLAVLLELSYLLTLPQGA